MLYRIGEGPWWSSSQQRCAMDWGLDFLDPDSGCVWQDPDSGFLNKNRIRTRFGFCNLLMKNGLWDWALPVIANYVWPAMFTIVLQVFQSVPRNDRKVYHADAMHEWFTHKLFSWMRDMAVQWQITLCCFRTTLDNPMHFGLAVVLYLWFSKNVYTPYVYIQDSCISFIGIAFLRHV